MEMEEAILPNLSSLQKKGTLTDFTFICENGNIDVHKIIIVAQSQLAYNIIVKYNGGSWNKSSDNLKLPWQASQVQDAVDILYGNPFQHDKASNILTLLQIAEYLLAPRLEDLCLQSLENLSEELEIISLKLSAM